MEGARFIETIRLENILSYGPGTEPFPLEPLNVLIGPNGSGKSNLIEALSLLAATPRDLQQPIWEGGGVGNWLWKGVPWASIATVGATVRYTDIPLSYVLSFTGNWARFQLVDELVQLTRPASPIDPQPYLFYHYIGQGNRPIIDVVMAAPADENRFQRELQWADVDPTQSVLSQRRDNFTYPELTYIADLFGSMSFYREWNLGHYAAVRIPQRPDAYQAFLLPDCSNLALVLSDLLNQPRVKQQILEHMRDFYPSFTDVVASVSGGTVQIFFHEKALHYPIPATRLSDGSLRYLCLLAILCHPNPPWVICIEEPEIGLHPDVIPEVAKLLIEASSRSQIFVTTHSDILVDALTDVPEAVIVCEKPEGSTQLRRLNADELKHWLTDYGLGQLWMRGEIGGNRW
jgi:predicted ATPase